MMNFKSVVTIHSWVSSMSWASYAQVTKHLLVLGVGHLLDAKSERQCSNR